MQTFYDLILPSLFISVLSGIHPILIVKRKAERRLYTNNYLHFLNLTILSIYYIMLLVVKKQKTNDITSNNYYKQNKVSNIGLLFVFLGGIIYTTTIYISGIFRTSVIKTVLIRISQVDNILETLNQDLRYKKSRNYQIATLFMSLCAIGSIGGFQRYNIGVEKLKHLTLPMWFVLLFPIFIINVLTTQFCHLVLLISERFKMINEQLTDLKKTKFHVNIDSSPQALEEKNEMASIKKLKILSKLYDELCQIAALINRSYKTQLMVNLVGQYGTMIFAAFYFYWMHSVKPYSSLCWILWATLKFSEILHITRSCESASKNAKLTANYVHKLLIGSWNTNVKNQLMEFSNQLMHTKINFTLWGMIVLNATLLYSVIGSAATFMIIMLQFQQASLPLTCKASIVTNATT